MWLNLQTLVTLVKNLAMSPRIVTRTFSVHHCKKTGHPPERCYLKDKDKKTNNNSNNNNQRNKGKINLVEDSNNSDKEDSIDLVYIYDSDDDEIL